MSKIRPLLQNAAVYSFSNILNALIPFLLLPILTRVLLPSDYGILAMFYATIGVLGAFTGLSVNGAVNVRFMDRENLDFPRYVGSCLCVLLVSTLVTLSVVGLFLKPLSVFTAIPQLWLLLAVVVSGGNFLVQVRLGIWMMEKRSLSYGTFQVTFSLLNMALSLVFVLILKQGYEGRLLGQSLAVFVFAVFGLASLIFTGQVKFRPHWGYIREVLSFGVPLIPHVIGGVLIGFADRFILNQKLGLESAGVYMVAVQIGMGIGMFTDAFNKSFVPWLYEQLNRDDLSVKRVIVKYTWAYFGTIFAVASVIAFLSPWLVLLIAGPEYSDASTALGWLVIGQAFLGMYLMVTNYIFYKRETKLLAWVTFFCGVVGVLLTLLLTPVLGISGAGLSFAITMFLRFMMTWYLSNRVCPMPWFCLLSDQKC